MFTRKNTWWLLIVLLLILVTGPARVPVSAGSFPDLVYEGHDGGDCLKIKGMFQPNGLEVHPSIANPMIEGANLYAPDLVRNGGVWNMYYGGWKNSGQGNDKIYIAVSDDSIPEGPWSGQWVIIDNGNYLHVNDPSVQKRSTSDWVMAYTVAKYVGSDYRDWIAVSTSSNGASWSPSVATPSTEIQITGSAGGVSAASLTDIARPALLWTGSKWKIWFDTKINNGSHPVSFLAESYESGIPTTFNLVHKYGDVCSFPGFYEPDVAIVDGKYVAVVQRHFNTLVKYESTDGIHFTEVGQMLSASDPAFGRDMVSNPGLLYDRVYDVLRGVAFGMTSDDLMHHDIGMAYTQYKVHVKSCPSTWHVYTESVFWDKALPMTFSHDEFCRIRIIDPVDNSVILDKAVDAEVGDVWRLVW